MSNGTATNIFYLHAVNDESTSSVDAMYNLSCCVDEDAKVDTYYYERYRHLNLKIVKTNL